MDILKRFCSLDREQLTEPFSQGEFTYATDGWIAVKVPRIENVPENQFAPNMERLAWDHDSLKDWGNLPEYSLEDAGPCRQCGGKKFQQTCPECNGDGEVYAETGYNEYLCDCKTCGAEGTISAESGDTCDACAGTGKDLRTPVPWATGAINSLLLEKIRVLPGVQLSKKGDGFEAYRFRFDGGSGMIMPMMK